MGKKINAMEAIYPDSNIADYLNTIETEVYKVFDSYTSPNSNKRELLRNLDKTTYWEIIEEWKMGNIPYPFDLRQAFSISKIINHARSHLDDDETQDLAYCIAWIGYPYAPY